MTMLEHQNLTLLQPNWPAPKSIKAFCSTRLGGFSTEKYGGLNLADHVADEPSLVAQNRQQLKQSLSLPQDPQWLEQVHGTQVIDLDKNKQRQADASVSRKTNQVAVVLTADCLPILFCDTQGTTVAAAHAGWRGLLAGVIESTVENLQLDPQQIICWLGPAISQPHFEVGEEVFYAFTQHSSQASHHFIQNKQGSYQADIYGLARQRLQALGIDRIYGGEYCSFTQAEYFYSYRRDTHCGRMASLIWIQPE